MRAWKRLLSGLVWLTTAVLALWCTGAIWYLRLPSEALRLTLTLGFAAVMLVALVWGLVRRPVLYAGLLLAVVFVFCWLRFQHPTGDRNWDVPFRQTVRHTLSADGKSVTIENVRDFHYRSATDYDVRYRTETYAFDDLESMDYSITHWDGHDLFGHIMVVFNFKGGRHLVLTPEARLEKGEVYELLPGFYRRYELMFIFATEEDAIQLRTNHRKFEQSEVLLYPTMVLPKAAALFLKDTLRRAEAMAREPEFYNGLTYNCFLSIVPPAKGMLDRLGQRWRGIVNGTTDRFCFDRWWLRRDDPTESFEDYRRRHSVNRHVENLVDPPDFSRLIRTSF